MKQGYYGCRVGIELTQVEVKFEDLTVRAKVMVGSRALPSVTNAYRNAVEVCAVHCQCNCSHTPLSMSLAPLIAPACLHDYSMQGCSSASSATSLLFYTDSCLVCPFGIAVAAATGENQLVREAQPQHPARGQRRAQAGETATLEETAISGTSTDRPLDQNTVCATGPHDPAARSPRIGQDNLAEGAGGQASGVQRSRCENVPSINVIVLRRPLS